MLVLSHDVFKKTLNCLLLLLLLAAVAAAAKSCGSSLDPKKGCKTPTG